MDLAPVINLKYENYCLSIFPNIQMIIMYKFNLNLNNI